MSDPKTTEFTFQQVQAWRSYERVRKMGKWNMFDPRARRAAKLLTDDYRFCMTNFGKLKAAAEEIDNGC